MDLQNTPMSSFHYREQLTKAKEPSAKDYFFIEKVLGHKTVKKQKFLKVKFLYYPNKFNAYVLESDVINKEDQKIKYK